jgi:predicted PhzF superfamily epimerase YddE/YHI9
MVRAFVGAGGDFGNPALVVLEPDGSTLVDVQRAESAIRLGVPAIVFAAGNTVRIYGSYGAEIAFGGHPVLATVEVLCRLGAAPEKIETAAGTVACRRDPDGTVWLRAPAAWSKPWRHYEMDSPHAVEALTELPPGEDFTQVWAWMDREAGAVRARLWAPRIGKPEDEACGSASMLLAQRLGRPLEVLHGRGSIIRVDPVDDVEVELGGRCAVELATPAIQAEVESLYA